MTTNENGLATSKKVEAGTYTFKEIKAPEGYSLPDSEHDTVTVTANWTSCTKTKMSSDYLQSYATEDNGTDPVGWILNGVFYAVKPSDDAQPAYATGDAKTSESLTVETIQNDNAVAGAGANYIEMPNTKTPNLPSTGGMGTYIFTIVGVAVVAIAAAMLIFRRKRA